jgi:hypothetical protein
MHRSARVMVLAFTLLLVAAFAIVPGTARADMNKPAWASGDFWVYALPSSGIGVSNATLRIAVTGTQSITVNGTPFSTYHTDATVTVKLIGTTTFPAEIWFSTDTLAIVKIKATVDISLPNISASGTFEISGNPPQTIQWPLSAGATWQSSTTVWTVTTNSSGSTYTSVPLTTSFEVQSDASISVPAGTFTTTPLKETETATGSYTMNYWSAQVGNWVRIGEYDSQGRDQGSFNLTSFNYQAGSFFTSIVFGLPVWIWLVLLVVILVAVIGLIVVRRRRPPTRAMPPSSPQMPPQEPIGPDGPPPP